jgi:hypothetical protein
MSGAGQIIKDGPADGGFTATDLASEYNKAFTVFNPVNQGVERFAMAI